MRLPELTELATSKDNTEVFTGYNHNLRNSVGEWYDQKNMTTDYYPVASPRDRRSVQTIAKDTPINVGFDTFLTHSEPNETHTDIVINRVAKFTSIYAKGCHSLAYTDQKIITLQDVYDEDNKKIGAWFTNNGEIVALNHLTPLYSLCDISVTQESHLILSDDAFDIFTFSGDGLKNMDISVGDHIKFYLSALNGISNDFSNAMGTVIEINDGSLVVKTDGTYYMYNHMGPDVVIVNNTKINERLSKFAYFDTGISKRSIVRMGSYICVFPDGVVYETANEDVSVPVFKVEEKVRKNSLYFRTVIKEDSEFGYSTLTLDENYRYEDNQIQYYIEDKSLWVNQPTYVIIYVPNETGTFGEIDEDDTVEFNYMDLGTLIKIKGVDGILKENSSTFKVLKKGTITDGTFDLSDPTDYIIVSGFVYGFTGTFEDGGDGMHKGSNRYFVEFAANNCTLTRKIPDIAFACESQNRIWCCSKDGHEIYASALGDPYNFYDYSGIATDSYAVNVGTDGEFTGCINYLGKPLFFKENALHYISGSYPSNGGSLDGMSYAVTTTTEFKGVEKGSENSLAVIDNILYYKSSAGIVAYDGAVTTVISDALGKEKYKNAVAGAYKNKYYVSMQDKQGVYHLFVYDTTLGTWCKEDDIEVLQFLQVNNELLFSVAGCDDIYCVSDENVLELAEYKTEDEFDWFCETGNFGYSYPNNKYLSRFQIRMQIADGAKATIYIQYNSNGIWHRKGEMTGKGIRTHLVPIVPVRCDHMKIKIAGKGDVKIFSITKIFEEGGDR